VRAVLLTRVTRKRHRSRADRNNLNKRDVMLDPIRKKRPAENRKRLVKMRGGRLLRAKGRISGRGMRHRAPHRMRRT
jgi:hypothetical protein